MDSATLALAHSKPGAPIHEWHRLEDHLLGVAALAADFTRSFGADRIAYAAGAWRDLGKYAPDFQAYLREDIEASVGGLGVADASLFAVMAASGAFAAVGMAMTGWWAALPFILAAYTAWRGILVRGVGREAREIEALGSGEDPTPAVWHLIHAYQKNAHAFGVKERAIRFSGWLVVGGALSGCWRTLLTGARQEVRRKQSKARQR